MVMDDHQSTDSESESDGCSLPDLRALRENFSVNHERQGAEDAA